MADIVVEEQAGTAWVTLNRPDVRNALSRSVNVELAEIATELDQRDSVRAVVITGAGDKAFCAGADLKERRGSRCVPPAPGMMPSLTSVSPTSAPSAITRRSHASASSRPPP
jgi:enoyl-CoA hydratase/carnithine racemase